VGDGTTINQSFAQSWEYDALGRVSIVTYPTCTFSQCTDDVPTPGWTPAPQRTVSYTYTDGALTAVPGFASSISYHPSGLMSEVVHSHGATFTQEPDPWGMRRPAALGIDGVHSAEDLGLWEPNLGQGGPGYTYDGAGNVIAFSVENFVYDEVQRVTYGRLGDSLGGGENSQSYGFDAFGNLTSIATVRDGTSEPPRTIVVDKTTNHLSAELYDDAGNQLGWGQYAYDYDAFGMMEGMEGGGNDTVYIYTADDERLWTVDSSTSPWHERFFLRDLDGKVLRVYGTDTGFDGTWFWDQDYVYRGGLLLATELPGATPPAVEQRHFHLDHLGTPRMITRDDGPLESGAEVVGVFTYFPFGEPIDPAQPNPDRMRFTGHERDTNAAGTTDDLDYMHARFRSPMTGRFLSVDPSTKGWNPKVPQTWNRYSYSRGNPLVYVDPDGEAGIRCDACGYFGTTDEAVAQLARDMADDTPEQKRLATALLAPAGISIITSTVALIPQAASALLPRVTSLFLSAPAQITAAQIVGSFANELESGGGGASVQVFSKLTKAPQAGRALSTATGEGAVALAQAAREGGSLFTATIPKALIDKLIQSGYVRRSITEMNGKRAVELRFSAEATAELAKYFKPYTTG
jgi:RHS repeat-associated protein